MEKHEKFFHISTSEQFLIIFGMTKTNGIAKY